jgi:apolipoprotein N-acyltransferase
MNLLLSLVTGALLVLLYPRFDFTWLAPFALTPLLVACAREPHWRRRYLHGWAAGFLFWFAVCVWIQFVLEFHGGMGRWGGWGAFVLFAILKGAYLGTFAALAGPLLRTRWAMPAVAALWCCIEHAHGTWGLAWGGLGFAWLDLGNAAIDWPWLLRLAPLTGVHGMSFVLAMTAGAAALLVERAPLRRFVPLAALPLLWLLPALPPAEAGRETVQVVQTNVDADASWGDAANIARFEQRLRDLSLDEPAPFIVWPEAPAPFYPDRPAFRDYVGSIARTAHASFLFGGIAYTANDAPLNSAFLVSPQGEIVDRYDKIELVPFGEYIPPAFGFVNRITGEAGDFARGTRIVTLPVNGHKAGAFICYESAFPALVRQFALQSEVLVNLSNDGYFGDSAAREQHLSLVRMRAAENARWILRATNDGITAMIDPAGRVTDTIPPHVLTSEVMRFNYATGTTLYTRYGDWFPWLCGLCAAIALAAAHKFAQHPHHVIRN